MKTGVITTEFHPMKAEELFQRVQSLGFESVQLSFASVIEADFISDSHMELPSGIPVKAVYKIKKAAYNNNISITACSGTFNMAHPDPHIHEEGVRRMDSLAAAARELGVKVISLCSGTRSVERLWSYHPDNGTGEAWADMTDTLKRIVETGESYGVTMAVETEYNNVVDTPERALRMLEEINSPRLGIIMDCANLFRPGEAYKNSVTAVMERGFKLLGKYTALAHGKDIRESEGIEFCPTGEGIIDYGLFLALLKKYAYKGDMILNGIYDQTLLSAGVAYIKKAAESM